MTVPTLRPDPSALQRAAMTSLTRAVIATGLGRLDHTVRPIDYAKRTWDDRTVDAILRAASSPASLGNTPQLSQVAVALLTSLIPTSAGAELLGRAIGLNFDGAAQISVPGIAAPAPGPIFVREGAPIPVATLPTSAGVTLTPHKVAIITSLTHEMLSSSNAETLIRQALIESCGPSLDAVLLDANAATPDRPAGLLHNIAALTPSAGTDKAQALVDDLQQIASAVAPVAGNGSIVLIASPDAAVAMMLRLPERVAWPILTSGSLAVRTVIAVASNAIVSALEGSPQLDASTQAEFVRDTAPVSPDAAPGASQVVGSLYQTDQVALRLRWPISWALRTPAGLAWMTGVNW
jgi:hypothetical protein